MDRHPLADRPSDTPPPIAMSLLALVPLYGGLAVLSGFLGNKQIALGPLAMESGLLGYIGVVVLSSTVAELHGRKLADRLVLYGFLPVLVSMALITLVLVLPASPRMPESRLEAFETILGQSPRIMLAGIVAYFVSVFLNVRVFSWLRGRDGGMGGSGVALMVRGGIASAIAQVVDGLIFISVAFYGVFPILPLLAGQIMAKVVLSLTAVPVLIRLGVAWGRKLDGRTAV
ncbi:hypothetical protein MB02_08275 [Croceicoccus estronivorus]|uniref:queuosine precursor transporter n=1 Tax=Croceicoccus estronivorus TaxID=1172626 RepID=UPI0008318F77|nr:queuosine precursor transporter [Croceicoccus estronivorus]OCC23822.1 hypothetical protein MB02_08275 [Croceicoccus estronivorus]